MSSALPSPRESTAALALGEDVQWSETALEIPTGLSYERWEELGSVLGRIEKSVQWWLGDWLNFGEAAYGEKYSQALDDTGLDVVTLTSYAWVSKNLSTRIGSLSWSHHREAASLPPSEQVQALEAAARERMTVRQFKDYLHRPPALPSATLPDGAYATIVADPPWRYDNKATRGAAEDHYGTMSMDELYKLKVPAADDAHLYLWVTNGMMREGLDLCASWGFEYKALLTWCKPQIGLGNYFRNATEHVIFGLRGKLATNGSDVPTWFVADRTRHSAKPDSFYDLVEKVSPGPYLEMFARRQRLGWETWGNEALEHVDMAA